MLDCTNDNPHHCDYLVILGPIIKQKRLNILGFQKKNNKLKDVVLQLQVGSNMCTHELYIGLYSCLLSSLGIESFK